jgi:pimeloyl-ACP methyl ester carboxylesterase
VNRNSETGTMSRMTFCRSTQISAIALFSLERGLVLLLFCFPFLLAFGLAKEKIPLTKSIQGHVTDADKRSLVGAKVFVKNLKQKTTTVLVTDQSGLYSVAGLDPKVDFEVHAEYGNLVSQTKTISSFLNRFDNVINFELGGQSASAAQASSNGSSRKSVELQTSDGVKIMGDWYRPSSRVDQKPPAILLIHGFGENRSVWDGFLSDHLLKNGLAILNIDLRGHGESLFRGSEKLVPDVSWLTDPRQFPSDLDCALSWLRSQVEIDQNRIGVLGADIGGSLAYLASGKYEVVRSAVVLSGNFEQAQALATGVANFQPHSILYIATQGDDKAAEHAQQFEKSTGFPVKVQVFQNSSSHGAKILQDVPESTTLVADWLKNVL